MPAIGAYAQARTRPDSPALIGPDGTVRTFADLGARVNQLSRGLRALGLEPGDRIAAIIHNGFEYFELVLAALQVGLDFVPVNWRLSVAELSYILRDSESKVVIAAAEQAESLPLDAVPTHRYSIGGQVAGAIGDKAGGTATGSVGGAVGGWLPYAELGAGESGEPPADRAAGTMMLYTSGTTGHPKGVHSPRPAVDPDTAAVGFTNLATRYGVTANDGTHLVVAPLYHAAPGAHALGFLHAGHTIVIHARFGAEAALRDIERYRVTSTHLVPTHFHRLLRLPDAVRTAYDLSSLEAVIHAGAPCPVDTKRRMIGWLGPIVWEYLGSTEGSVSQVDSAGWLARPGTVGRPNPGTVVRILNDGVEAEAGEPGTIYFGAPERPPTFEYLHDPDKTAASRHGNLVTVGDYGYLDADGYLFLLDRRTDLIISGGVNIYPAEVEQQLIAHPEVDDVAVIGVPDAEWGQQVLAVVQPAAGVAAGPELAARLADHCAAQLAAFKRPRRFEFVTEFPRTETGKVQRRVLRDTYQSATNSRQSATDSQWTRSKP